ncbi:YCF48-related protein [uncultured Mucilaginibacter sp.]|uniref:WD40/YVTN/BNR-like repeat-containing protein n=1 Tax=uncultured Mucilaginibacter sp. TaxID=797541 RepID=UPI0026122BDF|nr:YCF48-related protein [uncultured Mucilaginibacter sp.]
MSKKTLLLFLLLIALKNLLQAQSVLPLQEGPNCSIRGLSVVNKRIAWASGSKGQVGLTKDGGKTWKWQQIKGFGQSDFRDVEAFSSREAVIMSSGTPALILKTKDGGTSWQTKFRQNDKAYFLDALAFADDRHGFALGDPVAGKFLLLETKDGGESWNPMLNSPTALPGEAAFAASGTCISTNGKTLTIVTGGKVSRMLMFEIGSKQKNAKWQTLPLPLLQGKDSQGAFSSARNKKQQLVVGGDYQDKQRTDSVVCAVSGSLLANVSARPPAGYQSCVAFIKGNIFISTGTSGSNITTDNGKTWRQIDKTSYNVCQKAKRGRLVLLSGDQGKIAVYKN